MPTFLGHYGVAFGAKRAAPRASLGALVLAAQWLDEVWPIFLLLGIERVRIVPGLMAASPLDFVHYPYSHSLLAALGWGLLLALGYFAVRRYGTGAWIVGAAVVSHWLLDVPVHRPDLPLWPGAWLIGGGWLRIRAGMGAWNSIPLTLLLEGGFFIAGVAVYLRTTRARDRVGSWGLWALVAVLVAIYASGLLGPPPPGERALAVTTLGLWLFVPWGWWVDRHRDLRAPEPAAREEPLAAGG